MADSAAAVAADEPLQRIFRIVLIYQCCLTSVTLYDWILSLKKEYRLIWRQRFTVVSALYVGLRYFEFIRGASTIYLANTQIPNEKCPPWARWQVYSAMAYMFMVYVLFTLRASAIYGNSKIVMAFLSTLAITIFVLQGVASVEFAPVPWATGRGPCFAGKTPVSSNILVIFWLGPFVFDTVTTVMLVTRVIVIRRRGGSDSNIVRLLARDGLLYFGIISIANLINVGFYLGASPHLQSMNSGMAYDVTAVMCSRLILSLRFHAYNKEDSAVLSSQPGHANNRAQITSGLAKVRGVPGLGSTVGVEKGDYGGGMQAHIALSTFGDGLHRKQADEESLEDPHRRQMDGVYIITETKTQVDEGPRQAF